ncbi:MAG: hypothetical protein E7466_00435 [Ruminococcaceae bacterium]|nr:hypothetical protein [Oscillospiraceae bacterium]
MAKKQKKKSPDLLRKPWVWVVIFFIAAAVIAGIVYLSIEILRSEDAGNTTTPTANTLSNSDYVTQPDDFDEIVLNQGLIITDMRSYSGKYMEDGSNSQISDVMMLIVKNTNVQDIQLARIHVAYKDFTAQFQITNLPAGGSVVLLEQNKKPLPEEKYQSIEMKDVVFFDEPMSMRPDIFSVTSVTNTITIKNITDKDITGDIYIYYKNCSSDLFYGGITYRIKVEGGLKAGESKSLPASHYHEKGSRLLMINYG